jgi:Tfp pilus assembly protein PilN
MVSKKPKKIKRRQLACKVAIEISHSELSLIIVDKKEDGAVHVRGYRTQWLQQAPSLNHGQGVAELTAALATIVEQEQLAGGTVQIALSSDFCVTRVIAGETDKMLSELRNLRDRSAHYLSLGAGAKAISQTIRALDVKNSQGWLTVTNRATLDNLNRALENAGLFPDFIEHSMVAVCRAVGRMGGDKDAPAIIIEPNDRGVDLGISYRGQLLFDYRPGGVGSKETIVQIVEQHLERIQRYCSRFFRFAGGQLNRVYLVGSPEDVEQVRSQFLASKRLTAEVINPTTVCTDWHFADSLVSNPDYVAPLGAALVEAEQSQLPANERAFPNLMDAYRTGIQAPLWPLVKRHLWPVAAAGVLAAIVYSGAMVQHSRAGSVETQVATIEAESGNAATMKLEMDSITTRVKYLHVLDDELTIPPVHDLISQIVKVKPRSVFLDGIQVSQDGQIEVTGKAETKDAVFEFETGLKNVPLLKSPNVESTRPDKLPTTENATAFKLKAKFADPNGNAERNAKNG